MWVRYCFEWFDGCRRRWYKGWFYWNNNDDNGDCSIPSFFNNMSEAFPFFAKNNGNDDCDKH